MRPGDSPHHCSQSAVLFIWTLHVSYLRNSCLKQVYGSLQLELLDPRDSGVKLQRERFQRSGGGLSKLRSSASKDTPQLIKPSMTGWRENQGFWAWITNVSVSNILTDPSQLINDGMSDSFQQITSFKLFVSMNWSEKSWEWHIKCSKNNNAKYVGTYTVIHILIQGSWITVIKNNYNWE